MSGYLARKPCGCGADWLADTAPADYLARHLEEWKTKGYTVERATFEVAFKIVTDGSRCPHCADCGVERNTIEAMRSCRHSSTLHSWTENRSASPPEKT